MPTPLKLLILEDNAFDAELEVGKLQAAGYECDWQQVQTREEFEASLDRPEFELILADYALLEPFTLQASLKEGGAMKLGGMHRVDERKLEFLNAAQHKNLIRKGIMGRIYAHLISLENFARLLTRKDSAGGLA